MIAIVREEAPEGVEIDALAGFRLEGRGGESGTWRQPLRRGRDGRDQQALGIARRAREVCKRVEASGDHGGIG